MIHLIQGCYSARAGDELAVGEDSRLTDRQIELIRRVVDSIIETEGKPLRDISEDRVDHYVIRLSRSLHDATHREMHTSDEKGGKLLGELCASYPESENALPNKASFWDVTSTPSIAA